MQVYVSIWDGMIECLRICMRVWVRVYVNVYKNM